MRRGVQRTDWIGYAAQQSWQQCTQRGRLCQDESVVIEHAKKHATLRKHCLISEADIVSQLGRGPVAVWRYMARVGNVGGQGHFSWCSTEKMVRVLRQELAGKVCGHVTTRRVYRWRGLLVHLGMLSKAIWMWKEDQKRTDHFDALVPHWQVYGYYPGVTGHEYALTRKAYLAVTSIVDRRGGARPGAGRPGKSKEVMVATQVLVAMALSAEPEDVFGDVSEENITQPREATARESKTCTETAEVQRNHCVSGEVPEGAVSRQGAELESKMDHQRDLIDTSLPSSSSKKKS